MKKNNNEDDSFLDDVEQLSINLRQKLFKQFQIFWKSADSSSMEKVFLINTMGFSSVLTQMVYCMFDKKPENIEAQFEYIDQLAYAAKEQLRTVYEVRKQ